MFEITNLGILGTTNGCGVWWLFEKGCNYDVDLNLLEIELIWGN